MEEPASFEQKERAVQPPSKTVPPESDDRPGEGLRERVRQAERKVVPLFRPPAAAEDDIVDDDPGPAAA